MDNDDKGGVRLPSVSVVVPIYASEEDAKVEALNKLEPLKKKGCSYNIVSAEEVESGFMSIGNEIVNGRRFIVWFAKTQNVVFVHKDYLDIMKKRTREIRGTSMS